MLICVAVVAVASPAMSALLPHRISRITRLGDFTEALKATCAVSTANCAANIGALSGAQTGDMRTASTYLLAATSAIYPASSDRDAMLR
jgi:hypothetical protein